MSNKVNGKPQLNKEFIQVRIWKDCINRCTFCYLQKHKRRTITLEQKKSRLIRTRNLIEELMPSRVGLIGGDFFEGQIRGCESEWEELIRFMNSAGIEIFITANLIHEQYYLQETMDILKDNLLLCTYYDEVGRFHSEEDRQNWKQRIEKLHDSGANVFCTCIPTQEFFESGFEFPDWLGVNLCDPHVSVEWFYDVDKEHYNECLKRDNEYFTLPRRRSAIKWFRAHPNTTKLYADYTSSHSNTVYGFDDDENLVVEIGERLAAEYYNDPKCGHPYFCQCYVDSDKCMMCDAKKIAEANTLIEESEEVERRRADEERIARFFGSLL